MTTTTKFFCSVCKTFFESEKTKQESVHPIYGACWKYVAACPDCKTECDEYKVKVAVKSSSEGECCRESGGHQHSGCCCCN